MTATESDWQSWAALAVVALTAAVFALRLALRRKKPGGCGHDCGCARPSPPETVD